jgi:hypothetical protein
MVRLRVQLATLAARHALPTMYYDRQFAEVGGLMSYGTSLADQYRPPVSIQGESSRARDRLICRS